MVASVSIVGGRTVKMYIHQVTARDILFTSINSYLYIYRKFII